MEKKIEYPTLYSLQDKILRIVFSCENDFYLTGGTALHTFYYNARYSDDLDFFVSKSNTFREDIFEIIDILEEKKFHVKIDTESRDFYRIYVDNLKIDFVNDLNYRFGKSKIIEGFRIDNITNILTNKITAILGRDDAKDIFDLFCIAYHEEFNWKDVLNITNKKMLIEKDFFIYRLKTFPIEWLDKIIKTKDIEIKQQHFEIMCHDILLDKDNSLRKL